jgi:predicted  nucleic acid-binding Zn-ribbon protein
MNWRDPKSWKWNPRDWNWKWREWNWNLIGRVLVFVNLALSMGFLSWAFALYSSRIDYTGKEGQFKRGEDEIKSQQTELTLAQVRWQAARAQVAEVEARRPALEKWYADRITELRTGQAPVRALVYNKGVLMLDGQGYPALGPVLNRAREPEPGLASIRQLNERYNDLQNQLSQVTKEIDQLQAQEKALGEQIGNGRTGLRRQLAIDLEEEKNSRDEQEYLKPLLYNRLVQVHILSKRQGALEARLKELEGAKVAQKP